MQFQIDAMHCDSCVQSVARAILRVDPDAAVQTDLDARQIFVATDAVEADIVGALAAAGFPASPIPAAPQGS
jgi:copper chaperone